MESEIGFYLQHLRITRQLSTAQLARQAGVGRATLNRWQAGKGRPRLQELEAVLDEMAVSPAERTSALTLLASSMKRVRKDKKSSGWSEDVNFGGRRTHCGDLLRALRMRNGRTQAEVAQAAGTTQATVARWERGEVWPEPERLHLVAQALHVRQAEYTALLEGPLLVNGPYDSSDLLRAQWEACWNGSGTAANAAETELALLKLAAQAWPAACHNHKALKLLADIYAVYAEHLYFQRRFAECELMAQQAQDVFTVIGDEADPFWARAVLRGAAAVAQKGSRRAIERAIRQLRCDFPGESSRTYQAWRLSELGKMEALRGQVAHAVRLGKEAISMVEKDCDLAEFQWRQEDMARIYLSVGRPQEALDYALSASSHPSRYLLCAEACLGLERLQEARHALQSAAAWIDEQHTVSAHVTPFYLAEFQTLLAQL